MKPFKKFLGGESFCDPESISGRRLGQLSQCTKQKNSLEENLPKISVIMPVYNTDETYLKEAIESILNQTYTDFEFLILNDGSTNNAEDVICSYQDERINYVKFEQNQGIIKTLNEGLNLAQGEYVGRMDSDDVADPKRFAKQIEFFEKNPEIDILGTWFTYFPKHRLIDAPTNDKEIQECLLVNANVIGHPTVMFKRSIIERFGARYDEKCTFVEDYALWLSMIGKAKFANIPESLLNYRKHGSSICKTKKVEQSLSVQKVMIQAQGSYFNIDNVKVLELIGKLENNQQINSRDLLALKDFFHKIKEKMSELNFSCEYEPNKFFIKLAFKKCRMDLDYLKLLLRGKFN